MSGGGSVLVTGAVGITNNGTGAGAIVIDLPSNLWAFTPYVGSCAQFVSGALVGKSMLASLSQKTVGPAGTRYTGVVLTNPDGTYPTLTANDVLRFSIQYFDGTA